MIEGKDDPGDQNSAPSAGDVLTLEGSLIPFICVVMSMSDYRDRECGRRAYVCWLEHPSRSGCSDWVWESTLMNVAWRKLTRAA